MTVSTEILRRTPLHALHVALGAKMVPFAGYDMPVQYPAGVLKEHLHTRAKAGLFDVSHMGQAFLSGVDPGAALERLTPADVIGLPDGMQRYGLLLNDRGAIKDDFMVSRLTGEAALYLVVNAASSQEARFTVPYFVAATQGARVLSKKNYTVQFTFAPGAQTADFTAHVDSVRIALETGHYVGEYQITGGLQITDADRAYNQKMGRFAP